MAIKYELYQHQVNGMVIEHFNNIYTIARRQFVRPERWTDTFHAGVYAAFCIVEVG